MRSKIPTIIIQDSSGSWLSSKDSLWWRDIVTNDIQADSIEEGFINSVVGVCNKGNHILFWYNIWLGERNLKDKFPDLFILSSNKFCTVKDSRIWLDGSWK